MVTGLIDFLIRLGATLGLGSTIMLAVGALALALFRSPVARQRLGELTIAATLIWIVLACLPMRRFQLSLATTESSEVESLHAKSVTRPATEHDDAGQRARPVRRVAVASESGSTAPLRSRSNLAAGEEGIMGSWSTPKAKPVGKGWSRLRSPTLVTAYLVGVVLCGGWLALGRLLLARVELAAGTAPSWVQGTYQSLSGARPARLLVSPRTRRPFSYGILRPTIMLPAEIVLPDCARTLEHVLRHEQAHIQRRDAWGHALLNVAFPVLYVHPLYWWLRGRIQFARELIADDWASAGGTKSSYAQDLLRLLKRRDVSLAGPIGALGIYLRNPLARRMKMLLQRDDRLSVRLSWTAAAAMAGGSLLVVAIMSGLLGSRIETARGEQTDPTSVAAQNRNGTQVVEVAAEEFEDPSRRPAAEQNEKGPPLVLKCGVLPLTDVNVPARADGQITATEVKKGAKVEAEQVLARIDDELARLRSQASEYVAEAGQIQANTDVDVRLAQTAVRLTETEVKQAQEAMSRVKNSISKYELDRRRWQAMRSKVQLEQFETALKVARATYGRQLAEAKVARAELGHHRVVAPFAGVVVQWYVAEGDWVSQGDRVCRIVRMDRMKVEAYVSQAAYNPEELVGRDVSVTVQRARNQPVRLAGKITYVSPEVEASGEFQIVAEVDSPRTKGGFYAIRPGMTGKLTIGNIPLATIGPSEAESRPPAAVKDDNQHEIEYLTELVRVYEATWKRVHALYKVGAPGGEAENEAVARCRLCEAKAQLALAGGDRNEAIKQYQSAVTAVEQYVTACQEAYSAGAKTLEVLLNAQAQRAEVKIKLSRLRKGN